jgi:hypothetical protein
MTKDTLPFSQVIFRDRFLYLLIFILMLIAIQPLDEALGRFPLLLSLWSAYFIKHAWFEIIGLLCGIAFFAFIIVIILKFIFSQDEITGNLIAGAAVVYLLMAIMWSFAYRVIVMNQPGSFSMAQGHSLEHPFSFLYFSMVTLTTLGYGDIFPLTTAAKACAILEAVIGQLYLVITIAWLVGAQISQSMQKK